MGKQLTAEEWRVQKVPFETMRVNFPQWTDTHYEISVKWLEEYSESWFYFKQADRMFIFGSSTDATLFQIWLEDGSVLDKGVYIPGEEYVKPVDPTSMQLREIKIRDYARLAEGSFEAEFAPHNDVVGINGTGKTSLLHMLAGIAGNDAATNLIADRELGSVELSLTVGNETFTYKAEGRITRESIQKFKSTLPEGKRVNYALSDYYYENFQFGRCNYATFEKTLRWYFDYTKSQPHVFVRNGESMKMSPGDGIRRVMLLIYLYSMEGGPLLLDFPETSLDMRNVRIMSNMIGSAEMQTFVCTHHPEWLAGQAKAFSM